MIFRADGLWERMKKRSPRLAASDQFPEQTHVHHAFVTVIIVAGITAVMLTIWQLVLGSFASFLAPAWSMHWKLGVGCAIGNIGYLLREVEARYRESWTYRLWDGFLDVWVPGCFWIPAATGRLEVLYAMLAVYAIAFFGFRPHPAERPR